MAICRPWIEFFKTSTLISFFWPWAAGSIEEVVGVSSYPASWQEARGVVFQSIFYPLEQREYCQHRCHYLRDIPPVLRRPALQDLPPIVVVVVVALLLEG